MGPGPRGCSDGWARSPRLLPRLWSGPGTGPPDAGGEPWPRGWALLATGWWRGGLGTEAPTPAEARQNSQQNIQRLQREGVLSKPAATALAAARTQTPAARRLSVDGPVYRLASTVVAMVLGVWWGLRWPRRLSVLVIAGVAPAAVLDVLWAARAVQQRRPRMAAGYVLVAAGSVARLRAASAEPLR